MKFISFIAVFLLFACQQPQSLSKQETQINRTLDQWHQAATDADFEQYFSLMSDDAVFVGTDASEVWTKKAFMEFAKPYFDKGKAWSFKKIDRHIYISDKQLAWFDETLDTWMGVCRGSGVLEYKNHKWLLKHYVLSLTVPNDKMNEVIKLIR